MKPSAAFLKALIVCAVLSPPLSARADCPEGVRSTTAAEQQNYLSTMTALKAALPAAVPGWNVKMAQLFTAAPSTVCKGSPLTAGYDAVYESLDQRKKNEESSRAFDARIEALRRLSPEEQKEADDLYHQGSQLGYKSIAELKNKNQAESDRLRAEANKLYAASKAIQTAHLEKVFPQIRNLLDEQRAAQISPEVRVHLVGRDFSAEQKSAHSEPVRIEGLGSAWFAADKSLMLSLGRGPDGQPVWARLEGDRSNVQAIARLLSPLGGATPATAQLRSN